MQMLFVPFRSLTCACVFQRETEKASVDLTTSSDEEGDNVNNNNKKQRMTKKQQQQQKGKSTLRTSRDKTEQGDEIDWNGDIGQQLFADLLPFPSKGRVFIGFSSHQTTGTNIRM
jgi:hypothetical protein